MALSQQVPDEVWQALPPRRLPRGRVALGLVLVALLGYALFWLSQAGVLAPNISARSTGGSWEEGSGRFSTVSTLLNDGETPTTIESIAVSGTWVRLDRVTNADLAPSEEKQPPALPITLAPHQGVTLEMWFTVTDCRAITRDGLTVTAQASGPARPATIDITPDGQTDPAAPSSYSWSGTDPWNVPWPGTYAASACGVPLPPRP